MAFSPDYRTYPRASAATTAAVLDAGLRAYMLRVYNWMASGLLLTGIVAYVIANTSLINAFYPLVQTPFGTMMRHPSALAMISIFAPLAFVLVLSLGVNKLSATAAQALFWVFCAAMGASLTNIFLIYTAESIVRVFFITAGDLRGDEHLRLHDEGRPEQVRQLPDHGADRGHHRRRGEHLPAQHRAAVRDQRHRRGGVHRPDGLRHPADQGELRAVRLCRGDGRWRRSAACTTR